MTSAQRLQFQLCYKVPYVNDYISANMHLLQAFVGYITAAHSDLTLNKTDV